MGEYLACKVAMFRQCDTVIINRDTNMYDRVRESVPKGVKVILFGQKQYDHDPADARIGNVQMGSLDLHLSFPTEEELILYIQTWLENLTLRI